MAEELELECTAFRPKRNDTKILVYKVTIDGCNPCVERDLDAVLEWIRMALPGDRLTVEPKEMKKSEYAALPEYLGP